MDKTLQDPVLVAGLFGMITLSLATWAYLAYRQLQYGTVLPYEPRRQVPWGPWATLLAVIFLISGATSGSRRADHKPEEKQAGVGIDIAVVDGVGVGALPGQAEAQEDEPEKAHAPETNEDEKNGKEHHDEDAESVDVLPRMISGVLLQIVIVGMFVFAVAVFSSATARDMGLPTTAGEAARDVAIGVLACLASYIPVFTVRILAALALGTPEEHPMIQIVRDNPSIFFFVVAAFLAGVVAPVCEELSFRLLLQGWLEKWDKRRQMTNDEIRMTNDGGQMTNDEDRMTNGGNLVTANTVAAVDESIALVPVAGQSNNDTCSQDNSSFVIRHSSFTYGWLPIVISSAMFALAHFGNSTDPIPLFPLALILGFVFQRTHRILPSITAHAMFNSVSMLLLARMLYGPMAK